MRECVSWGVEHEEAFQAKADLVNAPPIPFPVIDHAAFISAALKGKAAFKLTDLVPPQIDGRDGKYFENKLTHTISYRGIGRLLGRYGEQYRLGTAFAVGPRLIVTAGHCVHLGGKPVTDLLFQPGFPVLARTIPVDRAIVARQWAENADYTSDIALLVTREVVSNEMWFGVKTHLPDPGHQG